MSNLSKDKENELADIDRQLQELQEKKAVLLGARPRPTIAELEALLSKEDSWDDDREIEIMPNGEVRAKGSTGNPKPLTMKEHLGGEYGLSAFQREMESSVIPSIVSAVRERLVLAEEARRRIL